MRRNGFILRKRLLENLERLLIRGMILAAVTLAVVQLALGLAKDPVDFYMAMAQKVEAQPLEINIEQPNIKQTWKLTLRASPAAPVRILQNGKVIGMLTRGEQEITVQSGLIQLDARNIPQIVRIQVIKKDSDLLEPRLNQTFILERNVQNIRVGR